MNPVIRLVVLLALVVGSLAAIPSYIERCSRKLSNEELAQCALDSAIKAIPHLVQGDKSIDVPSMNPLHIERLELERNEHLSLNFTNLDVYGLDGMVPKNIWANFSTFEAQFYLHIPTFELRGQYVVEGKIFILPIRGSGPGVMRFLDGNYFYNFKWELYDREGVQYGRIIDSRVSFGMRHAEFKMDNLFNGDVKLGDEMNKFLNEHWFEVVQDFSPMIGGAFAGVCTNVLNSMFVHFPYDEIFLP